MSLLDRLIQRIREEGPIPFHRFMELALYDPEEGYYTRADRKLGRAGDFYTAVHVHPLFGWTLAHRATRFLSRLDHPVVVEGGGGDGHLAKDILTYWQREFPDLLDRVEYWIVERSPALRAHQEDQLSAFKEHVHFASSPTQLPPFRGWFLANELLDAFPVRVFRVTETGVLERHVGIENHRLVWVDLPVDHGILETLGSPAFPGMVVEVPVGWEEFLRPLCNRMREGEGWFLDYGERRNVLRQRYPEGTLMAYRQHRVSGDVLHTPGMQDITAFVDFDLLFSLLEKLGCRVLPLERQDRFLMDAGILEVLQRYEHHHPDGATRARLAMKTLLFQFPTFRVARFQKNARPPRKA